MSFPWLRRFLPSTSPSPLRKAPHEQRRGGRIRFRPRVERLEDRLAPAVFNWDGGGGNSNWHTAANWDHPSDTVLPGAMDDAVIGTAFSGISIGLSGNVTVQSVTSAASLTISFFIFSVSAASSMSNTLTLTGNGTLTGAGDLTIRSGGSLNWLSGVFAGTGRTVIAPGVMGTLSGINFKWLDRTLDNAGTVNYTGSELFFGLSTATPGVINNLADGTFNITGGGSIGVNAGTGHAFHNAGTLNRSGAGGSAISGMVFNNTGTVDVQSGALVLNGGGSHMGDFALATGTTLQLVGAHTFAVGADITGSGSVLISFGTSTFEGSQTLNALTINSTGTTGIFNSPSSAATVTLGGGTLSGSGDFTITTSLTWPNGTMAGTGRTIIAPGATATLSGAFIKFLGRTLDNAGTVNYTGDGLRFGPAAGTVGVINNLGTGTFNATGTFGVNFDSPLDAFNNSGTFNRSGSGVTFFARVPFNNSGTVNVQAGRLQILGGGSSSGAVTVSAGATLHFAGGAYTLTGTLTPDAGSAVEITDGGLVINTDVSIPNLTLVNPGGLSGSGTVTITSLLTWQSGGMAGAGRTVIPQGATASLPVGDDKTLARVLDNAGTINYTDSFGGTHMLFGSFAGELGILNNLSTGVFNATSHGDFVSPFPFVPGHAFNNAGTFNRSGAGDTLFDNAIAFNNTGTVNVQEGLLRAAGGGSQTGDFTLALGTTLELGGSHTFAAGADITGSGTVLISSGTSTFTGGQTLNALTVGSVVGSPTATFNGASSVGTVTLSSGMLTFASSLTANTVMANGGTLTVSGSATVNTLTINGGTAGFNGPTSAVAVMLSSGFLGGSGDLTVNGTMTWSGGIMTGAGRTMIAAGVAAGISSTTTKGLNRNLDNAGTVNYTGTGLLFGVTGPGPGVINNLATGTFNAIGDGDFNLNSGGPHAFHNAGIFNRSGAGNTVFNNVAFTNTGAVEVQSGLLQFNSGFTQTAGTTLLNGGNLTSTTTLNIQGGSLTGVGAVTANVMNSGRVRPGVSGPGILTITGTYTQTAAGTLEIEVGGPTAGSQHDRLSISGGATLNGAINVRLLGAFFPNSGDSFQVLTFGSRTGDFTTPLSIPLGGGMLLDRSFAPTNLTLSAALRPTPQLQVASFTPTATGFVALFSRALNPNDLNLHDAGGGTLGTPDITLVGNTNGAVRGSVVVHPVAGSVTFVRTGGPLLADAYTVTLVSAANGFKDTSGGLLDGNSDGTPGDNFTTTFNVTSSSGTVVSVPEFARGPGQPVDVPATSSSNDLPLRVDNGQGVTTLRLTLDYNPGLLSITGASVGAGVPAGASVTLLTPVAGFAVINFFSPTPLPPGALNFVTLTAVVPDNASYTSKQVLNLSTIDINGGTIAAVDDDGLHVNAYFGDATGNAGYSATDATRTSRVVVGLDTGFSAYQLADPVILADITGNGALGSTDAARILQESIGLDRLEIPPLPATPPTIFVSGPDPLLSIPNRFRARPGSLVTVPVNLDHSEGLESANLALSFDPRLLEVVAVEKGSLTRDFDLFAVNWDQEAGTIRVGLGRSAGALDDRGSGSVLTIVFRVRADAEAGRAIINLRQSIGTTTTQLNEGGLDLQPDPSDEIGDVLDGAITIMSRRQRGASLQTLAAVDAVFAEMRRRIGGRLGSE